MVTRWQFEHRPRPGKSATASTWRRAPAADLDRIGTRRLLDRLVPDTPGFLTGPMPEAAIPPGLPPSYLVAQRDRIHKPRRQAAAAHLGATIIGIVSGHDPMLGQPATVADIINRAASRRLSAVTS